MIYLEDQVYVDDSFSPGKQCFIARTVFYDVVSVFGGMFSCKRTFLSPRHCLLMQRLPLRRLLFYLGECFFCVLGGLRPLRHDYLIKYAYFSKCYLEWFASISAPGK